MEQPIILQPVRITFFLSIYEIFFQRVGAALKKDLPNAQFSGISYGRLAAKRLIKAGPSWSETTVYTDYLRKNGADRPFDLAYLKRKEKELGIPNLPFYISSDRYISKLKYEPAMRMLELCIRFVEEALDRQNPELIIMDDVCCMLSYLIYKIAKKRGVPVWSLGSLKINYRLSIYDDCLDRRDSVERAYEELKSRELTYEERRQAENFLYEYVNHYEPLLYLKTRSKVPDFNVKDFWSWLGYGLNHLQDPLDVTRMNFTELAASRVQRVARHSLGKFQGLFEDPVPGEKYVFFPLQVQPERSTLILAPFLCDQMAVIENISKSLPVGCRLYVKDHPIFLGRRPLAEYRRLKSIYNVRLLKTSLPSFDIVKNADLVISISNTIGIEAILLERPLIVLGDTFYKNYALSCYLDNIKELPSLVMKLLAVFKPDRENLLRFIAALFKGSYPGTRRQPYAVPYVLSEQNVSDVSKALLAEIKLHFDSPRPYDTSRETSPIFS